LNLSRAKVCGRIQFANHHAKFIFGLAQKFKLLSEILTIFKLFRVMVRVLFFILYLFDRGIVKGIKR